MTVKDIEVYNLDVPKNSTFKKVTSNNNYQDLYKQEVKKNKYLQQKINELEKIQVNQYRNKGVI